MSARAIDATLSDGRWTVTLSDGAVCVADALVVATGNAPAADPPGVPLAVRASARYVAAPAGPGALDAIGPDEPVLVVGSGLTAVDVLVSLRAAGHRARVTFVSRRGLLPRPHAAADADGPPVPALAGTGDLAAWLRVVRTAAAAAVARGEAWQSVLDAAREQAPALWRRLDHADRGRFLRHLRPWWDAHRHRVPHAIDAELQRLRASGAVEALAGHVVDATLDPDGLTVSVRRRGRAFVERLRVGRLVNATGAALDLARGGGPFLGALVARGHVRPDLHRVGLDTAEDGAAIGADGGVVPGLWLLGGARRPADWESTAVPELRTQAAALAEHVAPRGRVVET